MNKSIATSTESLQKPLLCEAERLGDDTLSDPLAFVPSPPRMRRQLDSPDGDGIHSSHHTATPSPLHEQSSAHDELPWYRNAQQISAMISNFSTSYNVVNISLVLPILRVALNASASTTGGGGNTTVAVDDDAVAAVASSLLAGMMVGQVLGGALGDVVGPTVALQGVMMLQVLASLGSTTATVSPSNPSSIFWYLAAWRFVLGVGAGGVYPLAAVLSATAEPQSSHEPDGGDIVSCETAAGSDPMEGHDANGHFNTSTVHHETNASKSLHRVVLTFSMQGLGFIAVPLVTVPLLCTVDDLNVIWRIILGLGCAPGLILLLWRLKTTYDSSGAFGAHRHIVPLDDTDNVPAAMNGEMVDSSDEPHSMEPRSGNDGPNGAAPPVRSDQSFLMSEASEMHTDSMLQPHVRRGWWESVRTEDNLIQKLLGTAATWFLFDVLFYGNTLFQPIVIEAAFGARDHANPIHLLQRTAVDSLILTSIALPGYAVAGFLLGKKTTWCYCGIEQTPRFVMLQGFTAMAILYFAIGTCWTELRRYPQLLIFLYSLTFFFANYGPNTATFVLPSLVYSPECRSTFNGLCAAAGKLGALTGASLFAPAADQFGDAKVMLACAVIAGASLTITKLFVPKSLQLTEHGQHQPLSTSGPDRSTVV